MNSLLLFCLLASCLFCGPILAQVDFNLGPSSPKPVAADLKAVPDTAEINLPAKDQPAPLKLCGVVISSDGKVLCLRKPFLSVSRVSVRTAETETQNIPAWLAEDVDRNWIVIKVGGKAFRPAMIVAPAHVDLSSGASLFLLHPVSGTPAQGVAVIPTSSPDKIPFSPQSGTFWIGIQQERPLPGTPVLNDQGYLVGVVDQVREDLNEASVQRVFAPFAPLEEAAIGKDLLEWRNLDTGLPSDLPFKDPAIGRDVIQRILLGAPDEKLVAICDDLLQHRGESTLAWYLAVRGYTRAKHLDRALASAHQLTILTPKEPKAWALYGDQLTLDGQLHQALDAFQQALDLGALRRDIGLSMIICLYKSGSTVSATEQLEPFVREESNLYEAWLMLGNIRFANGLLPQATQAYVQALRLQPESISSWTGLAATYDRLQNWSNSIESYHCLRRLLPDQPNLLYNLGLAEMKGGAVSDARQDFQQALKLNPRDRDSWFEISRLEFSLQSWDAALEACQKATEIDSKFVSAWIQLGLIQQHLNHTDAAIQSLQKALELDPKNADALKHLGEIQSERNKGD